MKKQSAIFALIGGSIFFAGALAGMGCGTQELVDPDSLESQVDALEMLDESGLLAFVNDSENTTLDLLDAHCGLRSHAAANLIIHRDGVDGKAGTADDNAFDSKAEIVGIKYVGEWSLEQLYLCAAEADYLFADREGFWSFLNHSDTSFEILDSACAIRSDSAYRIARHIAGRDGQKGTADDNLIDSVEELEAVYMVGLWTMDRLYACAADFGFLNSEGSAL